MIRTLAERAESTQLSHLFGIAMTAVLITVVLTGVTGYVQDEREQIAERQLETIGNRLAAELVRVDELGRGGPRVSVRTTVQETVAGKNFGVELADGATCEAPHFHTDRCLVLEAVGIEAAAKVPLNVSGGVSIEEVDGGTFRIAVPGGSGTDPAPVVERNLRIGVARDFQTNRYGEPIDPTNRSPVARIEYSPGVPTSNNPVRFSGNGSFDADGSVVTYKWDLDDDGNFDTLGKNVSTSFAPGEYNVTLEVVDNENRSDRSTTQVRVSGLGYNGDLERTNPGHSDQGITFTVTNWYPQSAAPSIEITEILVTPKWTTSNLGINHSWTDELRINRDPGSATVEGEFEIDRQVSPSGLIYQLPDHVALFDGSNARISLGRFQGVGDLRGKSFTVGIRYQVAGERRSTVFTDTVGSPNVQEFRVETGRGSGDDVDAFIVSNRKLDTLEIDVGGNLSGVKTEADAVYNRLPSGAWEQRIPLGQLSDGVVKANLTVAKNSSVSAYETRGPKSMNRSAVVLGGDYVWRDAGDWDNSTVSARVVHDSHGVRQPGEVRIGYDDSGPGLAGYWPFDGSADDASGSGLDGSKVNVDSGMGAFGTPAFSFDGTDGYVNINGLDNIHSGTSSLAMWIKTRSGGGNNFWSAPGITGVEKYWGGNDIFWGWIDYQGRIGIRAGNNYGARSATPIDDGQWHHVVLTYNESDGRVQVFVDGTRVDTGDTRAGGTTTAFSSFGRIEDTGGTPEYFEGKIDEIRSYDRVLTGHEVARLSRTNGTMVTGWKTGSTIDGSDAVLQYGADVPTGTSINVTVTADTNGDGIPDAYSDPVALKDGRQSVSVTGLNATASSYRLRVEFDTDAVVKSPVLRKIALEESS
ncbi:MAG: LamG-like jellyroll fold domain-containing protein [Haloarculaceae archaeon]